jgi:hypothetical protein
VLAGIGLLHIPQHTVSREMSKSVELMAIKESAQVSGHLYFLVGSIEQTDSYDYRYKDGDGSRCGRVSKFSPRIVEDGNLTDRGFIRYYQDYKIYDDNILDVVWRLIFGPAQDKIADGEEHMDIYVPNGTVDRTIQV